MSSVLMVILVCAVAAIIYGALSSKWVLAQPSGTDRMREIASAIQQGASAYLRRQYMTIGAVGVVLFFLIGFKIAWITAWAFAAGAILSAMAGFIGMNISVRANVRTAEAARLGVAESLKVAFRASSVTGFSSRVGIAWSGRWLCYNHANDSRE
jgi:K(+)-stimulated pyrophosphate-energized sodium pump